MPRQARLKIKHEDAFYHVRNKAACHEGEFPLELPGAQQNLERIIRFYLEPYFCDLAAFQILGNHYHALLRFLARRTVEREELRRRARLLYPKKEEGEFDRWDEAVWQRLHERLFDVSELMRNINQAYARWHNKRFNRSGRFWGDRFQSTVMAGEEAVLEGLLYVDLNAFRANLCAMPWDWHFGSASRRMRRKDDWMMPLEEAIPGLKGGLEEYRGLLILRGGIASRPGGRQMPEKLVQEELARGLEPGIYARRHGCFTSGLLMSGKRRVSEALRQARRMGRYKRRTHPIDQPQLGLFALREQRPKRGP